MIKFRNLFLILTSTFLAFSCSKGGRASSKNSEVHIVITAHNLSEDLTRMSTKDDEVLMLVYDYSDTSNLKSPLVSQQFKFSKQLPNDFLWQNADNASGKNLLFILLEQDNELPPTHLDSIFRIARKEIITAFNNRNYIELEKYLGDDDILGAKMLENFNSKYKTEFVFRGTYRLDKYEYLIKIGSNF